MTPEQLAASGTEDGHQMAIFAWTALQKPELYPNLDRLHAIPNGGKRDPRTGAKMKATGVKPGVPDMFLPVPRHPYHGLYIELKRPGEKGMPVKKGKLSKEQESWTAYLRENNYAVAVCYGWIEAITTINWYYGRPIT